MFVQALFSQTVYWTHDFESDDVGAQPVGDFTFSPSTNTATNGARIIDSVSPDPNPLPTQSLLIYDFDGNNVDTGSPTHMRWDFNGGENVSRVRVDLNFQRMYGVALEDMETRIHFTVTRAGLQTNNSDFRPFDLRVFNNGSFVVNSIAGTETVADYDTVDSNHLTLFINSHDTLSVNYEDRFLGDGTVTPNTFHIYLNGVFLDVFDFHITPDPANAPQIVFNQEDNDLGRFAFYQDTKRQGAVVFDNLVIQDFVVSSPAPNAPTGLSAAAQSPQSVLLDWTDNADDETGFVIERRNENTLYSVVATVMANETQFTNTDLDPETEYFYRVIATNGILSTPSNEVSATTLEQVNPLIVDISNDSLVVVGNVVDLFVSAIGQAPLEFQWYKGLSGDTENPVVGANEAEFISEAPVTLTSYWVRVSNGAGTTDSGTITITVHTPQEFVLADPDDFDSTIAGLLPGDSVVLATGVYDDFTIEFIGTGSEAHPITLKADVPGTVILSGESRLEMGGDWLVVDGLVFAGEYTGNDDEIIQFRTGDASCNHCRVTNIAVIDYVPADGARTFWISFYGSHNRLDHSYFTGHDVNGVTAVVWLSGLPNYHRIDYNHFADRIYGQENGWETIRIGTSDFSLTDSFTTVEYNLFTNVNGEIEIISNKSGENTYFGNTFRSSQGTLTLRHGDRCLVDSNYFLGELVPNTGGIRVIGEDHFVINNYFEKTTGRDGAAITVYAGVENSRLNEYFTAHNATIAFNTFIDNTGMDIKIGSGFGSRDRTVLPVGVLVSNNLLYSDGGGSFVGGENPLDAAWIGNIAFGRNIGIETPGFTVFDPLLARDEISGLYRPQIGSPVIDSATDDGLEVTLDIDGQSRGSNPDVGADEVSDEPVAGVFGPLTSADTGPDWLGSDRIFDLPLASAYFKHAFAQQDGWYEADWFGVFYATEFPWVYHLDHGWIYANGGGGKSLYLWDSSLGWLFTAPNIYPWLYAFDRNTWVYYAPTTRDPRYFWDNANEMWFSP